MTSFEQGLLKSAKILLYHLGSIFLVGLAVYVTQQASIPSWFSSALVGFGLPVAVVNAVWAGIEQAAANKLPSSLTIDTAPNTPAQS